MLPLPSPPLSSIQLGPITVHLYAICVTLGVLVAYFVTKQRLQRNGESTATLDTVTLVAVLAGIIGARSYHVITSPGRYFGPEGDIGDVWKIWNGGLGIWGAIPAGAFALVATNKVLRHRGQLTTPTSSLISAALPAVMLAQAIGRFGNWFNQELFGAPTTLPWGLRVEEEFRPERYAGAELFHPTFLYESLWMTLGAVLFFKFGGRLSTRAQLAAYAAWYCAARLYLEVLRVDESLTFGGVRLNGWVSATILVGAVAFLIGQIPAVADRVASYTFLAVVTFDQFTKAAATRLEEPLSFFGVVELQTLRNPGAAFSMASAFTEALSVVALAVLAVVLFKRSELYNWFTPLATRTRSTAAAQRARIGPFVVGLFAGGVAGNVLDRIFRSPGPFRGHVVDFVSIGWWPTFNVADAALFSAVSIVVVVAFIVERK